MRKKNITMLGVALALAGMTGVNQTAQDAVVSPQAQQVNANSKATPPQTRRAKTKIVNEIGGIQLIQSGVFGLTPKEYGLRFGNGASRNGKTNFLRLAHNSKVAKRINRA